jgi:homoserine dehydrogenase
MTSLRVAVLGCGVVGREVVRLLRSQADDLTARSGADLELVAIAVRDMTLDRGLGVDQHLITDDPHAVVTSGDVDIVVELMGGIEPARTLQLAAMEHGAAVVTANKALLAADGVSLYAAAEKNAVDLYFEASVAGAIPLLRPIRESLAGDRITRLIGIVNGTSNYILSRMDDAGLDFDTALAEAQALGYAEADPSADIDGHDAAAKAAILASLAFHSRVTGDDVFREGIGQVTQSDIARARALGYVVKSLAVCELGPDGRSVGVRVHPAMVPRTHPLANVRGAYNAVFVESDAAGSLMFYGQGAGGRPTASAVLGDLVAAARHRVQGARGPGESAYANLPVRPLAESITRYHVAMDVLDRPGVLAHVAEVFASHGVSIRAVRQEGHGSEADLEIVTHAATDGALAATVAELATLESVKVVTGVLRVEGEDG